MKWQRKNFLLAVQQLLPHLSWARAGQDDAARAFFRAIQERTFLTLLGPNFGTDAEIEQVLGDEADEQAAVRADISAWARDWLSTLNADGPPRLDEAGAEAARVLLTAHAYGHAAPVHLLRGAFRWLLDLQATSRDELHRFAAAHLPDARWEGAAAREATLALAHARVAKLCYDVEEFGGVDGGMAQMVEDDALVCARKEIDGWAAGWLAARGVASGPPPGDEIGPVVPHAVENARVVLRAHAGGAPVGPALLAAAFRWVLDHKLQ